MHHHDTAPCWRTEEPAVRQRIDLTDQAPRTIFTEPYAALLTRLAIHLDTAPTHVDYAESRRDRPRHEQWQTLTTTIGDHEIVVATTTNPLDPGTPVHDIVVDGVATPCPTTFTRPLDQVLFDVAVQHLPGRPRTR